jgi:hypothetical protein
MEAAFGLPPSRPAAHRPRVWESSGGLEPLHVGRSRPLSKGALTPMSPNTLKWTGITLLLGVLAVTGSGVMARQDGKATEKPRAAETGSPSPEGRAKDPKTQRILAKLEEPISMAFPEDTPLEDVLKYVKQATTSATYQGIPIYVDPLGLQEAEKSMTSTVRNMDLEGVPLRRTLQLLLKQINLVYFVDDGMLCITSEDSAGPFPPSMREPSPILQKSEKAERGELSLAEMKELLEELKVRQQIMALSSGSPSEETHEGKQNEELKQYREQLNLLLKEIRGLIEILKAEKQKGKAAETK